MTTKSDKQVWFLEFTVLSASNLPALNKDKKSVDAYIVLWPKSRPKEEHKSKIWKKTLSPVINETFGFVFESLSQGKINDSICVQWQNWKVIGNPQTFGGVIEVPLNELLENKQVEKTIDITGTTGKFIVNMKLYKTALSEAPNPVKTHTGNSTKAYFNSITRTVNKKRLRNADRGTDTEVVFINVTVNEARNLLVVGKPEPYFWISLNSSQQIKYKSRKIENANLNSVSWDQEFGFEITSVDDGVIRDGLIIDFKNFNQIGLAQNLGRAYVGLSQLAEGSEVSNWYPINQGGEVRVSILRTKKKVEELEIQATSAFTRMNHKMIYALNLVRDKALELGLEITISIAIKLIVIETRMSVKLTGKESEEEKSKIKDILNEAEEVVENEQEEDEENQQEELNDNSVPDDEKSSIMKKVLIRGIDRMLAGLKTTLDNMRRLGYKGTCGVSSIIGAYGVEFIIGVDVEVV